MKKPNLEISEINKIAMQVMREVNAPQENYAKTKRLLQDLQSAIQKSRLQAQIS